MKLKFGKVGLLFLALVIALAGLGGAFAAWTTEVKFEGDVTTGYLEFDYNLKFSGTEAWKVEVDEFGDEIEVITGWLPLAPPSGIPVINEPIGSAFARLGGENEKDIVFVYDNIFPSVNWCADFLLHYVGSIPVLVTFNFDGAQLPSDWDVTFSVYSSNLAGDYNEADPIAIGEEWQMHNCDYVVVKLCLYIPQNNDQMKGQWSFSGSVFARQWNKLPPNGNGIDWAITTAIGYEPGAAKETAWALCCPVGQTCENCGGTVGWGQWFKYTVGQSQTTYPLVAGQDTTVGEVTIWTNDDIIIEFRTDVDYVDPWWEMALSHLYVGKENGYPGAPGSYPYSSEKNPEAVQSVYYHKYVIPKADIGVSNGDEIYIMAAHAEVVLDGEYFAFEFEDPGTTAILELLCTGAAYTWLVDFTVQNTGAQAIQITGVEVIEDGLVKATLISNIIGEVLNVGQTINCTVQVEVDACTSGETAGTVTLVVEAEAFP